MREFYPPPDIHRLRDNGFAPIPVRSVWDRCNSPGKQPAIPEWQRYGVSPPSEEQLDHFLERHSGGNWGIVCGNVVAIDIDILDPYLAVEAEVIARKIFGDTPLLRIGKFPKRLLVYRAGEPIIGSKRHDINVEVLALNKDQKGGQQFVAFGIHPATMEPYQWPIESPLDVHVDDLPLVYASAIDKFIAAIERLLGVNEARGRAGASAEAHIAQPIIRDEHDLIVDGREHLLTKCIWAAFHSVRDPSDPTLVADAAWERFSEEADLSRPHDAYNRPWSYEDALQKAKSTIKRHPNGPEHVPAVEPTYRDATVPLKVAEEQLKAEISAFFDQSIEEQSNQYAAYKEQLHAYHQRQEAAKSQGHLDFSGPPVLRPAVTRAVNVDPGVGKTHVTLEGVVKHLIVARDRGEQGTIAIAVPTHKLADELKTRLTPSLAEHGLTCATYRSRLAADPTSTIEQSMCLEPDRVKACQEISDDVATHACGSDRDGLKCPSFDQCAYQRQRSKLKDADVQIFAHPSIFHTSPFDLFKDNPPDALIIDEDFTKAGIEDPNDPRNQLMVGGLLDLRSVHTYKVLAPNLTDPTAMPTRERNVDESDTTDLMAISEQIHKAISRIGESGYLTRGVFDHLGVSAEDCWKAAELDRQTIVRSGIKPNMPVAEVKQRASRLGGNTLALKRARLFSLLGDFLYDSERKTPHIRLQKNKPMEGNIGHADVLELSRRHDIHPDWHTATFVLDATMKEDIVRQYLRALGKVENIRVEMLWAYVRQVVDTTNPIQTFVASHAAGATAIRERQRAIARLRLYIELQSMIFKGKGMPVSPRNKGENEAIIQLDFVFICEKRVYDVLLDGWSPPGNVGVDYSARLRGSDRYSGVAGIAVHGRTQVTVRDVEHLAAVLLGRMPHKCIRKNNRGEYRYQQEEAGIRLLDGSGVGVLRSRHPDPFVEDVRWSITEGGLLQSIGRARAVRRASDTPVFIDILTNIPLPIIVDELVRMRDLYPDRFDEMAMAGLVPGSDADAAKLFPELWKDAKAVKNARANQRRTQKGAYYPHREVFMGNSDPFSPRPGPRQQLKTELQVNILDQQLDYRLEGERGPLKTLHFRREVFPDDAAVARFAESALGKRVTFQPPFEPIE